MNKKLLSLLVSGILLAACNGSHTAKDNSSTASTSATSVPAANSAVVKDTNAVSVTQNDEEVAVAQKELLKVLSIQEEVTSGMLAYSKNAGPINPQDQQQGVKFEEELHRLGEEMQSKLDSLNVTNQDVKDFLAVQKEFSEASNKVHSSVSQINKETASGKLSEASQSLLKEMQAAQAKVLQQQVALVGKFSQLGKPTPAKEILQLKNIQNKEAIELASGVQGLFNKGEKASEETAKRFNEVSSKVNRQVMGDLKALVIQTPDVEAYRQQLVALAKTKEKIFSSFEKVAKLAKAKQPLDEASKQIFTQFQQQTIDAQKKGAELLAKYAQ